MFKEGNKGYWLGKTRSEETKKKISDTKKGNSPIQKHAFKKGHIPWNKGISCSEETKKKIREKLLKNPLRYWKNKKFTDEHIEKLKLSHKGQISGMKGKHHTIESNNKNRESHLGIYGANHFNWKGGLTPLVLIIRHSFKYRQWVSDVFTHNEFTCQECGIRGSKLNAHHIKSFSSIIQFYEITTLEEALICEELWNINNGVTLCQKCHKKLHKKLRKVKYA